VLCERIDEDWYTLAAAEDPVVELLQWSERHIMNVTVNDERDFCFIKEMSWYVIVIFITFSVGYSLLNTLHCIGSHVSVEILARLQENDCLIDLLPSLFKAAFANGFSFLAK